MRRLWAHLLIAGAAITGVFASFPAVLGNISTNGDFETRRQFTFQLNEREGEATLTDNSAKEMAKTMEERLIKAGVSSYEITTSGQDLVNVAFKAGNDSEYTQITTYLSFSGSFALLNRNDDVLVGSDFLDADAYLTNVSLTSYPTVVVPISIKESAKTHYEDLIQWSRDNPIANTTTDEESGEEKTENSYEVYLIYNYVEGDTYQSLVDSKKFESKILITLDNTNDDTLYYDSNKNSFSQVCGYADTNGNGQADPSEIRTAFNQADFYVNLFSAEALDFDVKLIRGLSGSEVWVPARVEAITQYGKSQMTGIIVAMLGVIIVVSLILAIIFRLGAVSAVATTLLSTFLAFLFMILTGLEYNLLAVAGLALVATLTLFSNVIYLNKLKDEAYRGRTLKKANQEASKKTLLQIIDIHVVGAVVGLLLFILGGAAMHTFASILLLGSLISVVISTLGIKGMMWLATNTTKLTGKYEVFGINSENVPNHMAEEQQRYYGDYADKDFTKKSKPLSIVGLALAVLSLVGIVVYGALNGGQIYNNAPSKVLGSEILITNVVDSDKESASPITLKYIDDLFADMKLYNENENPSDVKWDDTDTHKTLASYVSKTTSYTSSYSETDDEGTNNYLATYFQVSLNSVLDGSKVYAVIKDDSYTQTKMTLNEVFNDYFEEIDDSFSSSISNAVSLKTIETLKTKQSVEWLRVLASMGIALGVITLYMLIRYRLSRGLLAICVPVVASLITMAIFLLGSLIGAALPATIMAAVPTITIFFYAIFIMFASKEREMISEDKVKDNSYEHRSELSVRALGMSATSILHAALLFVFMNVVFMGFSPVEISFLYVANIFGGLLTLGLMLFVYLAMSNKLLKALSNVNFDRPRKTKKGGQQPKPKSAEPEEAIFIGIND